MCVGVWAEETTELDNAVPVDKWLVLGPFIAPPPAFSEEGGAEVSAKDLLAEPHLAIRSLEPKTGNAIGFIGGGKMAWTETPRGESGVSFAPDEEFPSVAYLAAYIDMPRWGKVEFEGRSTHPFELFIDAASVAKQNENGNMDGDEGWKKGSAKLGKGKHVIVVKAVHMPGDSLNDWRIDLRLVRSKVAAVEPVVDVSPKRVMNIGDVLDPPAIRGIEVSPDGMYVLLSIAKRTPPEGETESWYEIRRIKEAGLVQTLNDMPDATNWQWAPVGHKLSFVVTKDEAATLRVLDLDTGAVENIVEKVKDFSGYDWGPDGSFVVYSVRVEPEDNKTGVERLVEIRDRRRGSGSKTSLYLASVPRGVTRRMTAGEYGAFVYDIHPDGKSILVGRNFEDLSERPYSRTELFLLSIEDQHTELIWSGGWLGSDQWSPDGKKILATGGPAVFGPGGLDVPEGTIPNSYDTQAYIFDPETGQADPITRDFDPTIIAAYWPAPGSHLYFAAEETEFVKLYRYDLKKREFKTIDVDCDVVRRRGAAKDTPVAVVSGSGAMQPEKVFAVDLKSGKSRPFLDLTADRFEDVTLSRVEEWNFTSSSGDEIVGRIHYPPDFDDSKTWPCIVYYYGGTSPVNRTFGGRYPKNLWAANGYVVYVLQPSGATGFGQEFSARHVNDWGITTAGEIIEGTKKFLEAHTFVDPGRVGCIGASFGGFMTQLLVTKTDIFAAAISHAGISSISSYWGEGYWGYAYNAVSAANSFPWNSPEIYFDQSPLFSADKIETPLLLLHGSVDTNVPPGESEQMYTALKLLGKDVEYLRVGGQNHFVLDYKKRIIWSDAILAWFDKWLKEEPQWWDDTYPPAAKKKPADMGLHRVELEDRGTVLFGKVTREDFSRGFEEWTAEYEAYTADDNVSSSLGERMKDVTVVCVLGTWCGDSRREIPRLWKVLDSAGVPESDLKMFAVGSSTFTRAMPIPPGVFDWSDDLKKWYDVSRVATIILLRNGKEIGRIVEAPEGRLEDDLLAIVEH
jgi:dipeptidyl aminopeptidase/acylaminoacyl peptidase